MNFNTTLSCDGATVLITLEGELDALTAPAFRDEVRRAIEHGPEHLVLDVANVAYLSSAGLRMLAYARQKLPHGVRIVLVGANDVIQRTIRLVGYQYNVELSDRFPFQHSHDVWPTFPPPVV
jgi:anti-anti-sigma factor